MKQIAPPTSNYLLEAPIEILHSQSLEWLEEIAFWNVEVEFFYKLLRQAADKHLPSMSTPQAFSVERHLINVSAQKLDELKMEAVNHEQSLADRMESIYPDESVYRSTHRVLSEKFHEFEQEFKEMKMAIFRLVEEKHYEHAN